MELTRGVGFSGEASEADFLKSLVDLLLQFAGLIQTTAPSFELCCGAMELTTSMRRAHAHLLGSVIESGEADLLKRLVDLLLELTGRVESV